jgi:hypothetical protein
MGMHTYSQLYFSGVTISRQEKMAGKKIAEAKAEAGREKKKQIHESHQTNQNLCIIALYTYSSSISLEFSYLFLSVNTGIPSGLQYFHLLPRLTIYVSIAEKEALEPFISFCPFADKLGLHERGEEQIG